MKKQKIIHNNEDNSIQQEQKENEIKLKLKNIQNKKIELNKLKKEYDNEEEKLTKELQSICKPHKWERYICYGDPTSYDCLKCGLHSRYPF